MGQRTAEVAHRIERNCPDGMLMCVQHFPRTMQGLPDPARGFCMDAGVLLLPLSLSSLYNTSCLDHAVERDARVVTTSEIFYLSIYLEVSNLSTCISSTKLSLRFLSSEPKPRMQSSYHPPRYLRPPGTSLHIFTHTHVCITPKRPWSAVGTQYDRLAPASGLRGAPPLPYCRALISLNHQANICSDARGGVRWGDGWLGQEN